MRCFQIIILLFFITSCKTNFDGITRIETQVDYPHNIYGEPIKRKRKKRKIEYRIYDKTEILIEVGTYGERGGYIKSEWNEKDSTLMITNASTRNYKKMDCIEKFKYNENGELTERTLSICRNNKILYLSYQDKFYNEMDSMKCTVYKQNGEIRNSSNHKLRYPLELDDEIYNQKTLNVGRRILRTKKQEFIYDKEKRLTKILYKDQYDNILGYTTYKYKKLKTRKR